jgi:hypothetical protein
MGFEITGKLIAKYDTIQRTETFKTREFVIETSDNVNGRTINNYVKFQSVQDRTGIVDRFTTGETIKVHFNIKGSKWEKNGQVNYITNLDAWRIESVNLNTTQEQPSDNFTTSAMPPGEVVDDLPF